MKQILAVVVMTLAMVGFASATDISGPQSGVIAAGEYIVVGDLYIIYGETLTIEAGTTFLFDGVYDLIVGYSTTLICSGTETDSIRFMPNVDNGVTQWGHVEFDFTGSDDLLEYCLVTGGSGYFGGGINCASSNPIISHCTIDGNLAHEGGGGIGLYNSNPTISYCTISNNTLALGEFGGNGIDCTTQSNPTISNCTIVNNNSIPLYCAGIQCSFYSNPVIVNSVIAFNDGCGVDVATVTCYADVSYCDVYGNETNNFGGIGIDPGLGVIVGTNANGDPCDAWMNISLDPLFVNPNNGNFHLISTSPCIDAGDPNSPLDPDGTVADIGAFYYDQNNPEPVEVTLTPTSSTDLPAGGGTLEFDVHVVSNVPDTYPNVMFWTKVKLPNGNYYPEIQFQTTFTLTPYMDVTGSLTQDIPAFAPEGDYEMWGWVGMNPNYGPQFGGFFPFTKSAAVTGGVEVSDWAASGSETAFEQARLATLDKTEITLPDQYAVLPAYPNPFNPTTTVSVSLPQSADLTVVVFNTLGQQVAELVNGRISAGTHQFTFDGSSLTSGIYFVRASVLGELNTVQKIVLIR